MNCIEYLEMFLLKNYFQQYFRYSIFFKLTFIISLFKTLKDILNKDFLIKNVHKNTFNTKSRLSTFQGLNRLPKHTCIEKSLELYLCNRWSQASKSVFYYKNVSKDNYIYNVSFLNLIIQFKKLLMDFSVSYSHIK